MNHLGDFDHKHRIGQGSHLYFFYETPQDFLDVMIPYFFEGLQKGEACLWIVSERNDLDRACESAKARIPQFSEAVTKGQFALYRAEEWYLKNGRFSEGQAVENISIHIKRIRARGFNVLRAAGDIGAILSPTDWEEACEYEKYLIHPWIKDQPVIGLCAYPLAVKTPSRNDELALGHDVLLACA
jgi:hypothetical protein